jgi:alpha-L-fucosidase
VEENFLLNIGPTKEGTIDPAQEERLQQIGCWLRLNGDAIYESEPWKVQKDPVAPHVWYTSNKSRQQVYAIVLRWPGNKLQLASVDAQTVRHVTILGCNETVQWSAGPSGGTVVEFPLAEKIESVTAWTVVFHMKT